MLKQLGQLGRVVVIKGPLMLDILHDEIYKLFRYRQEAYGRDVAIDCLASFQSRVLIQSSMCQFYQHKYGTGQDYTFYTAQYERYAVPPTDVVFAVFSVPNEYKPILWFIDIANTTDYWEILEPNRHLAIVGFSGIGFKD